MPDAERPQARSPARHDRPWYARTITHAVLLACCVAVLGVLALGLVKTDPYNRVLAANSTAIPAQPVAPPPSGSAERGRPSEDAPPGHSVAEEAGVVTLAAEEAEAAEADIQAQLSAHLSVTGPLGEDAAPGDRVVRTEPDAGLAEADPALGPEAEAALLLSRADRRIVQRRLALAGHDVGTPDGVFGPATRAAIAEWQRAWGFEPTGYLTGAGLAALMIRTEAQLAEATAAERKAARRTVRPTAAPVETGAPAAKFGRGIDEACALGPDGRVLAGQGFFCSVRALGQGSTSDGQRRTSGWVSPGADR